MRKISLIILGIIILGSIYNCKGNDNKNTDKTGENLAVSDKDKQLNITFLLDLSDRIEPSLHSVSPSHAERDMAVVAKFVEIFKNDMRKKGAFKMKGKLRVIFSPVPQDSDINTIASKLNVDLSSMKPGQKKEVYDGLQENFTDNLQKIYDLTLRNKNYIGSDIWRFFKSDVRDIAVDKNSNYRNILVVITDGYIYHKNTKMKKENRYSYILPQLTKTVAGSDYEEKIKEKDFGLINARPNKDLGDLEVLLFEINPSKQSPYEEDMMKAVLSKWLEEMGVSKYEIYRTDGNSSVTTKRIKDYFE